MVNEQDLALFRAALRVGDIVFEYVDRNRDRMWLDDRRQEGVNPSHRQTEDGLFFELYYGFPKLLWTPWGE